MMDKGKDTRERIIEAAIEVFGKGDFDTATTDQVANASKVSKGTVFLHFNKKSDLIEQVALISVPYDIISNIDLNAFSSPAGLLDALATGFMEKYKDPNIRSLLLKTLSVKERYPRVKDKLREACMSKMDDFFSRVEELLGRDIPVPMRRAFFGALLCYVIWWDDNITNPGDYVRSLIDNFLK
ncbi:DNA-binding transcriptional repressor AcrR [Thermoplasmatales archaeon]|nr:DNA-binding transcriptional repressor AcrR [Thermoplasmatales archaeon]